LRPQTLSELRGGFKEAGQLADRLDDPLLAGHAAFFGAGAALEAGDLEQADRLLARLSAVAEQLGQPPMRWYVAVARAQRCLISGPAEQAERLVFAALELGRSADSPTACCGLWASFVSRASCAALDAEPWLTRLQTDWAAAPLTRRRGDDNRRAEQLLERSATYRRLA
jgi:hypothetical protein